MMSLSTLVVAFSLKCIIIYLLLLQLSLQTVSTGGNETDYLALLQFKSNIVHDPQNLMSSWNDSLHFCNWEGITCARKHRRVTILDLQSKGLVGSLSPYIGNMSFLREISLQNNTLQGEIPPELGHLFRLQVLNLGNNSIEGEIPHDLSNCSNLLFLRLSRNKLTGKIPSQLSKLSKLINLYIFYNNLNGPIPPSIGNLTSLEGFSVRRNSLIGTVPDTLGQLKHLSQFIIAGNKLSGIIPPSIYNISTITEFYAYENQFHGSIPSNIGTLLPQLHELRIWGNSFSGPIPVSLSNATKLENIDVGENSFTGKVEVDFGGLQRLLFLSMGRNNLGTEEGVDDLNFIASLLNCSHLSAIELSSSRLKGVLPNSKANLSSLNFLSIGNNQIYGELPQWFFTLASLTTMSIQFNQISGIIPAEIGTLEKIQRIYLDHNRLSGPVPSSIGNLSSLISLQLGENNFHSAIPSNLNWHKLLFLDLSGSNFIGSIPKQLFSISTMLVTVDLSLNNLEGTLPSEIGKLFNLYEFYVSENNLTGKIPNELAQCQSLEILYMDGNNFEGTLPSPFASLRGLRILDLSRNNLSGKFPKYLETLSLEHLNLSFNYFEGEVPIKGVFANGSAIFVEGNNRLCGGIPELKLPRCINQESKRRKLDIVKFVTIAVAGVFCLTILLILLHYKFRKKNSKERLSNNIPGKAFVNLSYEKILKATNGFSLENLLGVGSFGTVYKGNLKENGGFVAVKVINLQQQGAAKSFMAECNVLQNVRHRNLVQIITSCSSIDFQGNDFKALIYEYMPNGNLENWLHPSSEMSTEPIEQPSLNLLQRMNIAIDVANALDYLHCGCHEPIIHCDLKPSNILLDNDMVAHIGDFGLAKFLPQLMNPVQSSSIGARGTIGYTAPEYGLGSRPSTSGDVYSYGILLLEMVTGKKPTADIFAEGLTLHNFARMALSDNVLEIVDPVLLREDEGVIEARNDHYKKVECLIGMIRVGVSCSTESPRDRMDISNVVNELLSIRNNTLEL
ncbi:putative receptor-like protein kinase At3g47110 isoform X1 [Jatropha curcas]|uniref:putative receptor-like protein kinase At3g47110 isoform X1 n=1 Tax=Jatropha curcas TaxID=180498 RepID=UPI0018963948|nr:putative receptor-like protein kinase At3g47110 isoform X1 [Jatropha curcas]